MNFRGLTDLKPEEILLVGKCAYLHQSRINYLHEANASFDLIAFLNLSHPSLFPNDVEHDDAIEGRTNLHEIGVRLRVLHHLRRPVALDFQKADGRRSCLSF